MESKFIGDLARLTVVGLPPEEICLCDGLFTRLREQSVNF